jgi:hypothetical protein
VPQGPKQGDTYVAPERRRAHMRAGAGNKVIRNF